MGIVNNHNFVYYDHRHTIGIDIKQSPILRGLVTVNHFNTLTDVSQCIFRLRNINYGHKVDFAVTDKLKSDINSRVSLLLFLYKNDSHILVGSAHKNY